MKFLIMKGSFPSTAHLPAKDSREEAQAEVDRLEKYRAEKNKRARLFRESGKRFRGSAFLHRTDEVPWSYKEINT